MHRFTWAFLAGMLLAGSPAARAADPAPAGNWKFTLPLQPSDEPLPEWLLGLETKADALVAKVLGTGENTPESEVVSASFKDGIVRFTLKAGASRLNFEGKVTGPDVTKIYGTVNVGQGHLPAQLERTTLTSLDKLEVLKDTVANSKDPIAVMRAAVTLVSRASAQKAKPEVVRAWVDAALKSAELYGERWQREVILDLVKMLNEQDGMAAVTLPIARRAERMLSSKDRPAIQKRTLELLEAALDRAGKADEAKAVAQQIKKIDLSVRVTPFPGRTKGNRVVVFELFTGAECPPCVAADMGFDGINKTYKPSEVILLQYHEHIPGPDPLTNAQTEARFKFYQEAFGGQVRGTPTSIINGVPGAGGGGGAANAQDKYDQYNSIITPVLDEVAEVKIKASAKRSGDKIDIKADVSDVKSPGNSVRLRLVLVEEEVKYKGGNGLDTHHCVVRGFPGGVEGVAVKEKTLAHTASIDVGELKKQLTKYLEDFYKKAEEPVPKETPLELKKLRVVALVQDDNTREILQAVQVDVE